MSMFPADSEKPDYALNCSDLWQTSNLDVSILTFFLMRGMASKSFETVASEWVYATCSLHCTHLQFLGFLVEYS